MSLPASVRIVEVGPRDGLQNEKTIIPAAAKSADTSPTRRLFSVRSCREKPRSALSPWRTLSPSSKKVW